MTNGAELSEFSSTILRAAIISVKLISHLKQNDMVAKTAYFAHSGILQYNFIKSLS